MKKYKLISTGSNSTRINMNGGDNCGFEASVMNNPKWPPKIGYVVMVRTPKFKETFVGKVLRHVWNSSGAIISLFNHQDYIEPAIRTQELIPGNDTGLGLFLIISTYVWRYVDERSLHIIENLYGSFDLITDINEGIKKGYDIFTQQLGKKDIYLYGLEKSPSVNMINNTTPKKIINNNIPQTQQDLSTEAVYETFRKNTKTNCDQHKLQDSSLLSEKFKMDDLFKESEINDILADADETFVAPNAEDMNTIKKKLGMFEKINEDDEKLIGSKVIVLDNLITSKTDEKSEGDKIIKWLTDNLIYDKNKKKTIFSDLKMSVFNGYVYISRTGLSVDDKITKQLIPDLKFFEWQYDKPINYNTLKYVLFQNQTQQNNSQDLIQQKEAEKILSQEYLIALQPEPLYNSWVLKRLILCWYGDVDLQNNVRKIKILINIWRAKNDKIFNKTRGILPIIVVYPRYGTKSARIVLTKLLYYFSLYQHFGWKCAVPSYFFKVNNLIWYTNGTIDLKLYFRKTIEKYKGTTKNRSFTSNYTKFRNAKLLDYKPS